MGERWKIVFRSKSKTNEYTKTHHRFLFYELCGVGCFQFFIVLIPFVKKYILYPSCWLLKVLFVCVLLGCCAGRGRWWCNVVDWEHRTVISAFRCRLGTVDQQTCSLEKYVDSWIIPTPIIIELGMQSPLVTANTVPGDVWRTTSLLIWTFL